MRRRRQKKLTFDIKGSTVDRHVNCIYRRSKNKELTCYQRGKDYAQKVLKDMNFCELNDDSKRQVVRIPSKNAKHLRHILKEDSKFLMSQGIMDYSLLLVTEILPEAKSSNGEKRVFTPKYGRNSY